MTETAETSVPAEGTSESTPAPAGGDTSASTGGEGAQAEPIAAETVAASDTDDSSESLIDDAEFERLQDDPAALRKAIQSAFTKKSQQLGPFKQLAALLAKDPQGTVRGLAKTVGLNVQDLPTASLTETKDEIMDAFETVLGPESAKQLAPALEKLLDKKLAPFKQQHESQMAKATAELAANVEKAFTQKRPDWKKHEPAMMAVAKNYQLRPGPDVEPVELLDALYVLATGEGAARSHAERLVTRINGSARAIAESKVSGAAPTAVQSAPKRYKTPGEAARAALRGE